MFDFLDGKDVVQNINLCWILAEIHWWSQFGHTFMVAIHCYES